MPVDVEAQPSRIESRSWIRSVGSRLLPGMGSTGISDRIRQAVHGSAWTLGGYGASQILRLATQLVLAHLLLPAAFGLVALASVFLSGLEMLSDLGIGMDVVQHPRGDDPRFINTAFLIQVVRGIILFIVAASLAYPFAIFYHQPAVRMLAMVAALSTLFRGFASGSIWTMTRHVKLRELTLLTLGGDVVGLIVSLIWVMFSPTAWALVVARVVSALVFAVGSHFLGENRITLDWDPRAARDILVFGTGIFLSTATYFMSGEAERLIVGKLVTVAELGCFSLALTLASAPSQALNQVIGQVFFPMIADSIRRDHTIAANHYKRARYVFFAISVALGVTFVAYSPRMVSILLPAKYAMTGWMLQLLGWRAALQVFVSPTSSFILARGDSRTPAIGNVVRLLLMLGGLAVAFTRNGLHGAIMVLAFSGAVAYVVVIFPYLSKYLRSVVWVETLTFAAFLAATGLAAIVPWPWR